MGFSLAFVLLSLFELVLVFRDIFKFLFLMIVLSLPGLLFFAIVPISVVALFKKIKALADSHAQLAQVLRSSTKLVSFSSSPSHPSFLT